MAEREVDGQNTSLTVTAGSFKLRINPDIAFVVTVLPLAAILVFIFLGDKSFWLDEAFSAAISRLSWPDFFHTLSLYEANQGFYYVLLKLWGVFGNSEFAIRSFSALTAVFSVGMAYILVRHLFGWRTGFIAGLLLTVNATFITYAQEARGYMLALFLVTASSYFLVKAIEKSDWRFWALFVVCSALGIYTHIYVALVLIAQFASLIFLPRKNIPWRSLGISAVAILVLAAPMAYFVVSRDIGQIDWVPQSDLYSLVILANRLSGGGGLISVAAYGVFICIALFVIVRTLLRDKLTPDTWKYIFVGIVLVIPVLISFVASYYKPMFIPRYFIILVPFLVCLIAIGIISLKNRRLMAAAFGLVLIVSIIQLVNWYSSDTSEDYTQKENWREATDYVLTSAREGDAIVFFPPFRQLNYDYYRDLMKAPGHTPHLVYYFDTDGQGLNVYHLPEGQPLSHPSPVPDTAVLEKLQEYDRIWLVLDTYKRVDIDLGDDLYQLLVDEYGEPVEKNYYPEIRIALFTNTD